MSVQTVTHLNFRGNAREALDFYRSVFGGEQRIATYRAFGNVEDPSQADQVIWGQVVSDKGFRIMAYDVPSSKPWQPGENAFYVSVRATPPTRSPPTGRRSPTARRSCRRSGRRRGRRSTACCATASASPGSWT